MNKVLEIHSREELVKFLHKIIEEETSTLADKILSYPSGISFIFVCRQYDPVLGYMVFTSVTINGLTREMWLPVMDGANKSMLDHPYTYKVKKYEYNPETRKKEFMGNYDEKQVEQATMFDINKTIMRCLTKNLAMFGLGIYIYAGEDVPIELGEPCTEKQVARMRELKVNEVNVCKKFKKTSIEDLSYQEAEIVINSKEKALAEQNVIKGDK